MRRNDIARRSRLVALLLVVALGTGCVAPVFNDPMTLSTAATAIEDVERLGDVSIERCNYLFLIFPIASDPRDIYDDLLEKAVAKGGNAVVDFELRGSKGFIFFPLFARSCYEAAGEAARIGSV